MGICFLKFGLLYMILTELVMVGPGELMVGHRP